MGIDIPGAEKVEEKTGSIESSPNEEENTNAPNTKEESETEP